MNGHLEHVPDINLSVREKLLEKEAIARCLSDLVEDATKPAVKSGKRSALHAPDNSLLKKKGWYSERELHMSAKMLRSEAFTSLTHTSKYVLMLFLQRRTWKKREKGKRKGAPIYNNRGLRFPYGEAAAYGIGKSQFRRAIGELFAHGFLVVAKQGGQFLGVRECSEYDLIDDWELYGLKGFKPRTKPRAPCFSSGFKSYNEKRKKKADDIREPLTGTEQSHSMAIESSEYRS